MQPPYVLTGRRRPLHPTTKKGITMLNDSDTAVTPHSWWERTLDRVVDVLEDRILDPVDEFVTPKVECYQAETAHRLASNARRYVELRAVRSFRHHHRTRARLLHVWASLESAAAGTRRGVHEQHTGFPDGSDGCCSPLIQLYADRAELIRALTVMEEQIAPLSGRSPNFSAMPGRIRRIAGDQLAAMAGTYRPDKQAQIAESLVHQLRPHLGAAVEPLRRLYTG